LGAILGAGVTAEAAVATAGVEADLAVLVILG